MTRSRGLGSALAGAALGLLASCGPEPAGPVSLVLDATQWPVTPWRADGAHQVTVHGVVQQGGAPLSTAVVEVDGRRSSVGKDGSFTVSVDKSFAHTVEVRVISPPGTGASAQLSVAFPIRILGVAEAEDSPQVLVDAQLVTGGGVSFVGLEDWAVEGTVRGADGSPVRGAVVSITEYVRPKTPGAHVENFAGSAATDATGHYRLYTVPESDTDVTLHVTAGNQTYTLPPNHVLHLPDETSSRIDVRLPAQGNVIVDRAPSLVSRGIPGARWRVLVVGATEPGRSEAFESTVIDEKGRFRVRLNKAVWQAGPAWFEQTYRTFQEGTVRPGDWLRGTSAGVTPLGARLVVPAEAVLNP